MNILLGLALSISTAFAEFNYKKYQVGDVIMQSDAWSNRGVAPLKLLHMSNFNHAGIVVERGGRLYVAEALSTVRYTPLEVYVKRGKDYKHLRLKEGLTQNQKSKINKNVKKYIGKKYDYYFGWSDNVKLN